MHATLKPDQIAADQRRLDDLIATIERGGSENFAVLMEHLKCARVYLLGCMPNEYVASLEMARTAASALSEPELRRTANLVLDQLWEGISNSDSTRSAEVSHRVHAHRLAPRQSAASPAVRARGRVWKFLEHPVTWLGTFYPQSFVTAVLPSLDTALASRKALRDAGFEENEVIAVSATEMLEFFGELQARRGVWGELMVHLSRAMGTEQLFADMDLRLAHEGDGFLLVYSPDEADAERIREIIVPFGVVSMQRYLPGGVEGVIKAPNTSGPER